MQDAADTAVALEWSLADWRYDRSALTDTAPGQEDRAGEERACHHGKATKARLLIYVFHFSSIACS